MSQIKPFSAPYRDNYGSNYTQAVIAAFEIDQEEIKRKGRKVNENLVFERKPMQEKRVFIFRANFWPDAAAKNANAVSRPIVDMNGDEDEFNGLFSFEATAEMLAKYNQTQGTEEDKESAVIEMYIRTVLLPSIKLLIRA